MSYKIDDVDKFSKEVTTMQTTSTFSPVADKIQTFSVDLNGGYAFSWLSGFNDATGYDGALRSSYQVGIGINVPINGNWGIETGVGYLALAGNSYSYYDLFYKVTGNIDLSYVEVPLLVKYDFLKNLNIKNGTSVGLKTGLQVGFNTQATDHGDSYSNDFDAKTNLDWVFGVFGYIGHSGVSINFNYGLTDVVKSSENSNNFRNKGVAVLYSYRF